MLGRVTHLVGSAKKRLLYQRTFRKFCKFTMVPEAVYGANLHLSLLVKNVQGEIIECGTWRGGMIAGIADVLGPSRRYRLFDSYEGLPPAKEIDGEAALAWQRDTTGQFYYDNCRASEDEARLAMSMSAAKEYEIVKGWFSETLARATKRPIALLRMDADWYDSTKQILENLAPYVVPGGLILVDDYYVYQGCARAVNEYAAERNWMIRQYPLREGGGYEVCYIVV